MASNLIPVKRCRCGDTTHFRVYNLNCPLYSKSKKSTFVNDIGSPFFLNIEFFTQKNMYKLIFDHI